MNDINQLNAIHQFNEEYRLKFNPAFFAESDEGIVEEVKKVILSCQRSTFFTIKVEGFEVVEDYSKIMEILRQNEDERGHGKLKENIYDYINLKDTAMRLLIVSYFISIKEEAEHIKVIIALPRAVDKYYFRINGNTYSALWQVVDASTYNSSTSSSKKHSVTLKTMFQPIRVYRYVTNHKNSLKDFYSGNPIATTFYTSYIFKKSLPVMKYLLARFGYYGCTAFLHLDLLDVFGEQPPFDPDMYVFNKYNIWFQVPRVIFDKEQVMQSFIYTVYNSIQKQTQYQDMFTNEFWLLSLSGEFNNLTIEKGLSILDSLEFIYDISTKETLRLPEETKKDIYSVLKWMIGEFNSLRIKDNLDVSIKRIRRAEYIASLYAMKLSTAIYRVSDIGKKADINSIKKAIVTAPMYLINAISSCKLINYRNFVGDLDSMVALKYTYKGISGIGEKSNSMPNSYRAINPTQLSIVDLDSSPPGDPGASGTLNPYKTIETDGMFTDYREPNSWEKEFAVTIANYKAMKGYKEVLIASKTMLGTENDDKITKIDEALDSNSLLIKPLIKYASSEKILCGFPLEESGLICYETLEEINQEGV